MAELAKVTKEKYLLEEEVRRGGGGGGGGGTGVSKVFQKLPLSGHHLFCNLAYRAFRFRWKKFSVRNERWKQSVRTW